MNSTTLTIDQIRLSPFNVRTRIPAPEDTATLEASILVEGLRVPIDVHRMRGSKTFGAFAGRRRYFAIKRLVERGDLDPKWPVPHKLHDATDAELIERSITENLLRTDMEDHELYAGVAMAAAKGHTPAQIATNLGQNDVRKVARWMRLGQLAPEIFKALVEGTIGVDQAMAFAGTEDRKLQAEIFRQVGAHAMPSAIRRALKIGDAMARRYLSFVGEAIYRAAGGRYELDLFAEAADDRGRVVDEGLLQQLVEEKMATVREQVRHTTARPELRFVPAPPEVSKGVTDNQLAVTPRMKGDRLDLPAGDIVAHIALDATGEPLVSYWWATRRAKFGSEKPAEVKPVAVGPIGAAIGEQPAARSSGEIRRDEGLSQDATFALRAVRKAILRAALADDADAGGEVGLDFLVFVQMRALLTERRPAGLGMRIIASDMLVGVSHEALALGCELVDQTPAARITANAIARLLARPFFTEPDLGKAFIDFVEADVPMKRLAAALVAGMAMERSLATDGLALHDVVAHFAGADRDDEVRRNYWTPTAEQLELLNKEPRRAIAEPFVDRASFASWEKLKSAELTTAVLTAVTRPGGKGETWVHPLLRFTSPFLAHQAVAREAAE